MEHLTGILSEWTGVPVEGVSLAEGERLANLENPVGKHILDRRKQLPGANSIRVGRAGCAPPIARGNPAFPRSNPAWVKPRWHMHWQRNCLAQRTRSSGWICRVYEPHHIAKLLAHPRAMLVTTGRLAHRPLRRNPHGIVLFDEVEKAHRQSLTCFCNYLTPAVDRCPGAHCQRGTCHFHPDIQHPAGNTRCRSPGGVCPQPRAAEKTTRGSAPTVEGIFSGGISQPAG